MKLLERYLNEFVKPKKMGYSSALTNNLHVLRHFRPKPFTISTYDETSLRGMVYVHNSQSKRCVLYTHSHSSNLHEGDNLLENCARNGMSLIVYDSRGCGTSDGKTASFGEKEQIDLFFILLHAMLTHQIDSFVLYGRSIGCCAVLRLLNSLWKDQTKRWDDKTSFINRSFTQFIDKNKNEVMLVPSMLFTIESIVLDSPVYSIQTAVSQFFKQKFVNVNFVANYISSYTQKHVKKNLGVDVTTNQNHSLVKIVSTNVLVVFSKKDYFIANGDKKKLLNGFGLQSKKRPYLQLMNIDEEHNEERTKKDLYAVFDYLIKFRGNESNYLRYEINNNFNINKIQTALSSSNLHNTSSLRANRSAKALLRNKSFKNPVFKSMSNTNDFESLLKNHSFLDNKFHRNDGKTNENNFYSNSSKIKDKPELIDVSQLNISTEPVSILEPRKPTTPRSNFYGKRLIKNYSEQNINTPSLSKNKSQRRLNTSKSRKLSKDIFKPNIFKSNVSAQDNEIDLGENGFRSAKNNKIDGHQGSYGESPLKRKITIGKAPNLYQQWSEQKNSLPPPVQDSVWQRASRYASFSQKQQPNTGDMKNFYSSKYVTSKQFSSIKFK